MSWDYAQMSKIAKQSGGPEKWIGAIKAASRAQGRREMVPVVALALGAGAALGGAASKIRHLIKLRRQEMEAESAEAERIIRAEAGVAQP